MPTRRWLPWSIASATALLLALTGPARGAQDGAPAGEDVDAQAMERIERMSDFLARAKRFRVTVEIGYDVVQDWGQKIEFGETRVVTVRRPDRFRVDTTSRDGSESGVLFDGAEIAAFDKGENVYATVARPGSLDDAIAYFVDDLGMKLPMAALFQGRLPHAAKEWAHEVRYVEASTIGGVPCDHVALHGDWEDVQLWIARGDRPLLQRMVITYTRAEGKPQFWAQLTRWDLSPWTRDATFEFTPPKGAAKIAFRPRRLGPAAAAAAAGALP